MVSRGTGYEAISCRLKKFFRQWIPVIPTDNTDASPVHSRQLPTPIPDERISRRR
jgi:hypothetical protein